VRAVQDFRQQPPEFWALVKLVSQTLGYSERGTGRLKRYGADEIEAALARRGLAPDGHELEMDRVVEYVDVRADLLELLVEPNLMSRDEAAALFREIHERIAPPEALLTMNKQRGEKRHPAYLASIVNMLTYETLMERHGRAPFDWGPRAPLTFARDGMPLRTLFRWMDGAYPDVNHPHAAWEIKEYYGTKTFGSRVADGVYETALDGYEFERSPLRGSRGRALPVPRRSFHVVGVWPLLSMPDRGYAPLRPFGWSVLWPRGRQRVVACRFVVAGSTLTK
jgi:hypothetical protein